MSTARCCFLASRSSTLDVKKQYRSEEGTLSQNQATHWIIASSLSWHPPRPDPHVRP